MLQPRASCFANSSVNSENNPGNPVPDLVIVRANNRGGCRARRKLTTRAIWVGRSSASIVGDAQADARNVGGLIPICVVPLSGPVRRSDTDADESPKVGRWQYRHQLNFDKESIEIMLGHVELDHCDRYMDVEK